MSEIDWSHLDGRLLQLLVAVLETGSVTGAAQRLGVTQSAVSHLLDKLRAITGDPLFVRKGRGIAPTAHARALLEPAREMLARMQRFSQGPGFDPACWRAEVTIAANDFQRELLLPALAARLRAAAPLSALRIIDSGAPDAGLLRSNACLLAISPRPPDATDILQKRLFSDAYALFHDASVRSAPVDAQAYLRAEHATVAYAPGQGLDLDQQLQARGLTRRFAVRVPGFAALAAFVRGTPLLVTAPSLLGRTALSSLASAPVPVECPPLPMYMIWHARHQADPAHAWLRGQLDQVAQQVLGPAGPSMPAQQCAAQQARCPVADLEGAVAHGRAHAGA
ncbi:Symbiotic regulator homolog 1 [Delftia tsuruhatensis]|nr:Symbiotic regulator homolog 1 [Delftia tsuruhatensis]CAC9693249.1 Symbiotic regulator homolog 1 [Delftia tsuruhatensis]